MLKTVSSITNAIGSLNFKGTWNANTNTPTLASGVGTKGDYYVVGVAGSTTLDGISNWGVGDWATYNGSVWQRVEGGADLNGVNLSVSGTSTLSGLTASTALALNASKEIVSVTNTGTGNNVLGTSPTLATPTLTGNVQMSTGNLVIGTAGKGIDFSADPSAPGMTGELLDDYEEGTWTPTLVANITLGDLAYTIQQGYYVKVGNVVTVWANITFTQTTASSYLYLTGLPFASANLNNLVSSGALNLEGAWSGTITSPVVIQGKNTIEAYFYKDFGNVIGTASSNSGAACTYFFAMTYRTA
jgi:hypothetical protein